MKPKLKKFDGCGDIMPRHEFIECVECGGFIDYDGMGNFATETMVEDSGDWLKPSHLSRPDFVWPEWATHVCWYNK